MNELKIGPSETNQLRQALRRMDFFADAGAADLDCVINRVKLVAVETGRSVIRQGEDPSALYIILEGDVAVKTRKWFFSFGKVIKTLGPGNVFGEIGLIQSTPRSAFIETTTPCKLFVLSRQDFDHIIEENEPFRRKLASLSVQRKAETASLS